MAEGNPFGAPVQAYGSPTSKGVGNPFDPMQQDPFAAAPPPPPQMDSAASVSSAAGHSVNSNPFGAVVSPPQALSPPPAQHQQQQQQQQYHAPVMAPPSPGMSVPGSGPYGQPQYGQPGPGAYPPSQSPQQSQQQQQYSQGAPPAYGGHHQGQVPAGSPYDNALVPSQQPTNPYAIVPVASTQQGSQWSVGGGGAQPMAPQVSSSSFDPFAPPPPPAPAPAPQPAPVLQSAPAPQPVYAPAPEPAYAPAPAPQQQDPSGYYPSHQAPAPAPAPYSQNDQYNRPAPALNQNQSRFAGDMSDPDRLYDTPTTDPTETEVPRNRYSQQLARVAPPGASPLPKSELVRKKGFVLSRISFRTIVMKKWKQSFWVQYGPHTMLWFRSRSDFDDWLNNPYHNQAERNFLIKLAVNFVHDLYKPNVRGYQVTQCRTKGYGKKMVRQFKLERWMDYGPTIAAAFGSYNPKEVDDLREALVECMRNTPLNGGIRATGAVRQQQAGGE
jgi:ribosomal protein S14